MKSFNFISKAAFEALVAKAREEYLAQVANWIAEFKSKFGTSKTVKLPITTINTVINDEGNMAVVVNNEKESLVNNTAFTLKPGQLDAIANQFQLPDIETLARILASTFEPSYLVVDLRPVEYDEEYTKKDGSVDKYKCPGLRAENFSIELSEEAQQELQLLMREVNQRAMLNAGRKRKTTIAVVDPTPEGAVEP